MIAIVLVSSTKRRTFANPMDTVVYGAAVGLGFAAYENLAYLVQHAEMWRSLAALRSVLTVPFHGALGIIAGAYLDDRARRHGAGREPPPSRLGPPLQPPPDASPARSRCIQPSTFRC